ncbi:MgtC/SapB family protein [Terricaulis sp.]|uniref:MgtC/SapB family protein n=1 Tax=Terricaulis sp. TaxID=2768686 RepID=UPI0037840A2B
MPDPMLIDLFQRLGMALGIGFLVGVERGWKHRDAPEGTRTAGLRTHAVIGLLGGICGALLPAIGQTGFAALAIAFAAALIVFKVLEAQRDNDVSVTGTMGALLVFGLGVYAMWGDLTIAAAAGVTLVGLLAFKDALHGWIDKVTWKELRSALLILAATAIALPLLPDRTIDIWGAINPRELWLLTILVAGASFAGYVAVRVLGPDIGVLAGAAAGSMVSSTVVTAELGRQTRAGDATALVAASAACVAAAVSVGRVIALVAFTATPLAYEAGPALAASVLVFAGAGFALRALNKEGKASDGREKLRSPLDLASVAKFAIFLGLIIVVGRIVSEQYGQAGLLPFAATAGLADVDAVTLAAGSLVRGGLDVSAGAHAVMVAVLVNTFSKAVIALGTGGWRYAGLYVASALAASAAAAAVWFFATPILAPMFGGTEASLAPRFIG